MKTKLSLLLVIALIIFHSCKKSETSTEVKTPLKVLTRIVQLQGGTTSFTTFTYDDNYRLKTIRQPYGTQTYTYDGNVLSLIEDAREAGGVASSKTVFSFSSGKPTKAVQTFSDRTRTFGYIFSGETLTEIHVTENGVAVNQEKYTYENHNLKQTVQEYGQGPFTMQYKYGTNKNKFINSGLNYLIGVESIDRYSLNEVLESRIIYPDGSTLTSANAYTYDSQGFPVTQISIFTHSVNGKVGETKFTYEYELIK